MSWIHCEAPSVARSPRGQCYRDKPAKRLHFGGVRRRFFKPLNLIPRNSHQLPAQMKMPEDILGYKVPDVALRAAPPLGQGRGAKRVRQCRDPITCALCWRDGLRSLLWRFTYDDRPVCSKSDADALFLGNICRSAQLLCGPHPEHLHHDNIPQIDGFIASSSRLHFPSSVFLGASPVLPSRLLGEPGGWRAPLSGGTVAPVSKPR